MENNENITPAVADDVVLLPEGWSENDDIFADADGWTGALQEDAPAEETAAAAEETDEGAEEAPTTEPTDDAGDTGTDEGAPTTEPTEPATNKLKFKARVDRQDLDVELDESEIPTLYQKAQVTDRLQGKLNKQKEQLDAANGVAKLLGYADLNDMLTNAKENYSTTTKERLAQSGMPEEIVTDYIERQIAKSAAPVVEEDEPPEQTAAASKQGNDDRDFYAESLELLQARPDLQGKNLPGEVYSACMDSKNRNKPLLTIYNEWEAKQDRLRLEQLTRENSILRQNAAAAAKAPVKSVKGGADNKPEDAFLLGFNSD